MSEAIWLSAAAVAAMIRKDLKEAFPGMKFSVRCQNYAGGSSVDVRWIDGPTKAQANAVIHYLDRQGFDGMEDMKTNAGAFTGKDGKSYRMGSFIFFHRSNSPEALRDALERCKAEFAWTPAETPPVEASTDGTAFIGWPAVLKQDYGLRWQGDLVNQTAAERSFIPEASNG